MTDPLTGKELVQKSYEYVDKLTKECAKVLLEDFNKSHRKFQIGTLAVETSKSVVDWFDKREKNIRITFDKNSVLRQQPTQIRMRFRGNTKDADFTLDAVVGAFVVPGTEVTDNAVCFVKTLVINADKNNFTKRKL